MGGVAVSLRGVPQVHRGGADEDGGDGGMVRARAGGCAGERGAGGGAAAGSGLFLRGTLPARRRAGVQLDDREGGEFARQ